MTIIALNALIRNGVALGVGKSKISADSSQRSFLKLYVDWLVPKARLYDGKADVIFL
jgi:hypothetical protein